LLQCSQHCHQGVMCPARRYSSLQCSQNLCGPFLRAVLPTKAEASARAMAAEKEDKTTHNSSTKVSFSTKNTHEHLGQRMTAITMVQSNILYAIAK